MWSDEGTPTSDANCDRHVGVSEKWYKRVLMSHLPNWDSMAPILKQQEEALPKPYSSCGPFPQSSRGAQWRDHQRHKSCVAKAGLSSKSYTELLLKQPFFSSPVPETFLSVFPLTLNFPSEQRCPHCAYSPHPQPHSRACLKLCQIGRGSARLQGSVPAHPRESKTNRAGRSWEQKDAKQSWCCIALILLLFWMRTFAA